jgi:hypothetical protein
MSRRVGLEKFDDLVLLPRSADLRCRGGLAFANRMQGNSLADHAAARCRFCSHSLRVSAAMSNELARARFSGTSRRVDVDNTPVRRENDRE